MQVDRFVRQVQGKDGHLALLLVKGRRGGHGVELAGSGRELRGLEQRAQGLPAAVERGVQEGIVGRLRVGALPGLGHDDGQAVDQLRQAAHAHAVRAVDHRAEQAADAQRVHDVVGLLLQGRGDGPGLLRAVVAVPGVPLVQGDLHDLLGALVGLDVVRRGDARAQERVQIRIRGQVRRDVALVAVVAVHREEVHVVVRPLEHLAVPLGVGRDLRGGGPAGDQLDRGVDPLHHLGGLVGDVAVLVRGLGAGLPGAVHLVAQAPDAEVVRLLVAVGDAQVAPVRAAGEVAVFDQVRGLLGRAGAQVHRDHGVGPGLLAPVGELVDAELVRLQARPGVVQAAGALVLGADAVLPMVFVCKAAARPTEYRNFDLLQGLYHVVAHSVSIRNGGVFSYIQALINAAAQVLGEVAIDFFVDLALLFESVDDHFAHKNPSHSC